MGRAVRGGIKLEIGISAEIGLPRGEFVLGYQGYAIKNICFGWKFRGLHWDKSDLPHCDRVRTEERNLDRLLFTQRKVVCPPSINIFHVRFFAVPYCKTLSRTAHFIYDECRFGLIFSLQIKPFSIFGTGVCIT